MSEKIRNLKLIIRAEDYEDGELIATDEFAVDNQIDCSNDGTSALRDSQSSRALDILFEDDFKVIKMLIEQNKLALNKPFGKLSAQRPESYKRPSVEKKSLLNRIFKKNKSKPRSNLV